MANPWFKFYGSEYLSDPKFFGLGAYERSCWITILSLASQTEDGVINFFSESQLYAYSGISPVENQDLKVLDKFQELGMIDLCNGVVTVKNWNKRQRSEGYERVKAFRQRQSNANVTDREKEREKERTSGSKEPSRGQGNKYIPKAPDLPDLTNYGRGK
jgi:hypothetical protein